MISLLLAAAAASVTPQPGELKTFKDWIVGCDNGWRCHAESLVVDEQIFNENGTAATMGIVREPGADGMLTVSIDLTEVKAGQYALMIDGKRFSTESVPDTGTLTFAGAEANALVLAIAGASTFVVQNSDGTSIAQISTAGSAAAVRYIDDRQRRAGTVTALAAKGAKGTSTVPDAPALPVIKAAPAGQGQTFNPTPAEIAAIRTQSGCTVEEGEFSNQETALMDDASTLIMISCGSGAYNYSSVAYVATEMAGRRSIVPARFDFKPGWGDDNGNVMLVNARFSPESGILASYAKGRGIGDCGGSEQMVWDGERFRLIEAEAMGECRGNMNWITTWRAKVKP